MIVTPLMTRTTPQETNQTMAKIPSKIIDRIAAGVKRFQPILTAAKFEEPSTEVEG
jgi:hypothetical protein